MSWIKLMEGNYIRDWNKLIQQKKWEKKVKESELQSLSEFY